MPKLRALALLGLFAGLAGLLVGFAWLPGSHSIRPPAKGYELARPWFVADAERMVEARQLEFNATETASPVLDSAQTRLYISLRDGRLLCRFRGVTAWTWSNPSSLLAAPLLDEATETIYVAPASGILTALNRITGAERWSTPIKEELTTTPFLDNGKLFVMSSDESVTAIEAGTGKTLWKFHRDRPGGFTLRGNARPVVAHGLVFAGFADGFVAALRVADGVAKWTRNPSGPGDYLDIDEIAAPENDKRIYVASAKSGISALEVESGESLWTRELPGANHIVVDGPRLYGTGRGAVVALSRRDGAELWRAKLEKERFATKPVAIGGLLLLSQERGILMALDPVSGVARAALDPGSGFSQPITAVDGAAFILSNNGTLFSLGLLP